MIPGLGRSPGEGKGYPLQYSGLENFMDCIVHGVAKSWTQLSDFHFSLIEAVGPVDPPIIPKAPPLMPSGDYPPLLLLLLLLLRRFSRVRLCATS